jgi:RND family efflux transporter MFP subunit
VTSPDEKRPRRTWVGWTVVVAAAVAVAVSFLFTSDESSPQAAAGPRVAPVSVAEVTRGTMVDRRRYPGELDAETADVAAFFAGRVQAVAVRVGDAVQAGAVLAELDPIDAREQIAEAQAQARAAVAEEKRAKVEHAAAAAEVARMEPLFAKGVISELELDNQRARAAALAAAADAAAARGGEARARVEVLNTRVEQSRVRAPFAGRVAARHVDPGATVSAGAPLVRVVATGPLWVRFQVPEEDVATVERGARLRVVTGAPRTPTAAPAGAEDADPGIGVAAEVTGVAGEVDRQRRVVTVEARLATAPAFWLPGMFAEVIVDRRRLDQATIVPGVALLSRLGPSGSVESGVFVLADGRARWTPVTVLARSGDRVAVDGPLAAGARVLVAGHADLADGTAVQPVAPAAAPAEPR